MSLLGSLLGGLGLLEQSNTNNSQEDLARQQLAQQQGLIQRQENLFDTLRQIAEQADQQGAFDPNRQLQLMQNQVDYDRTNALGQEAAAAKSMGYRPGDTAPLDAINQTRGAFDLQLRQLANNIINQSLARKLAAYGAANPSSLNAAMGVLGDNARFSIGREVPLGGMLGALAPYIGNSNSVSPSAGYVSGSTGDGHFSMMDYWNSQMPSAENAPAGTAKKSLVLPQPAGTGVGANAFAQQKPRLGFNV